MKRSKQGEDHEFDVCLSFAGEDRAFVRDVAKELVNRGIRVFYDEYEEVGLWGKDLYEHLDDVYKNAARYCIVFVSRHYARKVWTNHERKSAQDRALKENREYILPARFDNTPVPGLRSTVGYLDLREQTPASFAEKIAKKIGGHFRGGYLPPVPDRLYKMLDTKSKKDKERIYWAALAFLTVLKRMSQDERSLLYHFFREGCPAELPHNVHINADLLRRVSGFAPSKIARLLGGLRSLGFSTTIRKDEETPPEQLGSSEMLVLEWDDLSAGALESGTMVANAMIYGSTLDYCEVHGLMAWDRLDFSQLASTTAVLDNHAAPSSSGSEAPASPPLRGKRKRTAGR